MNEAFRKFAHHASVWLGSPWAFTVAFSSVATWAVLGLMFGFSDSWQLLINTSTTIVTFLMVFLIQNTQNRDNRAIHAKLDELIVKTQAADNALVESEEMSEEALQDLEKHFHEMAHTVRARRTGEESDAGHTHHTDDDHSHDADDDHVDEAEDSDADDLPARTYHRIK